MLKIALIGAGSAQFSRRLIADVLTRPSMLAIGQDIRRRCPDALWLNYVNPMNMIMWTIGAVLPELRAVGLCHSVQGTAEKLARFVGLPHQEVAYQVAGINHQAWFL